MVYHGMTAMCHNTVVPWYTMVYNCVPWYNMAYHMYIMVYHGIPCFWFTVVYYSDVKRYPINDISVAQIDIRMSNGHSAYRKYHVG